MTTRKFDVIIIGAGPAGVTAAAVLAGTGISVALIEAGVYAGAENWSGCVYFAESLAEKDCFGPAAVEAAPFERHVVRRGTLLHNGLDEVGVALTDPAAFRNCYTVLRPVYDPYFAHLARSKGAVLLTETTVTSLIRKSGRVVGVETSRGPLLSGVVFLAEGDASHLVRSEGLERRPNAHFLQGVKAVLTLPPGEIDRRFGLNRGEGAAYEILIRNAAIAGRTARLNVGGFLYTNRDSLSLGYVLPLDNLKKQYRGDHSRLLEWIRSLPSVNDLVKDASLSAYGTKLIRSGGWSERPVLVEDGLAVGGASAGLGVDIPFPNFTGPASATGLYFARAVKKILKDGRSLDRKNLTKAYLEPLKESVYGQNARYLSRWPNYFGRSSVLFGRTVDLVCGTTRFLSTGSLLETGRFLRSHVLSFRGLRETLTDTVSAVGALRLWKPIIKNLVNPATYGNWALNAVKREPSDDARLRVILNVAGKKVEAASLPWPIGRLIRRISPSLTRALAAIYANDNEPAQKKFADAARIMARSVSMGDLVILPLFAGMLFGAALATALWDAFRYYALKTPAEKMLAEPVMAYNDAQRKARDLDAIKLPVTLEAKLAANTSRIGSEPHIRTLWPEELKSQPDLSQAALWWVCPARVYVYDAPLFGRGRVTVNWENCIKCESCWRAEPGRVLWGRFTDHKLIYRPESAAIPPLLNSLKVNPPPAGKGHGKIVLVEERLWNLSSAIEQSIMSVLNATAAFQAAVAELPASADVARRAWPAALGARMTERMAKLESLLAGDARPDPANMIKAERTDLELRIAEGRLFHALYCALRTRRKLEAWISIPSSPPVHRGDAGAFSISYDEVSKLFPDRIVKEWEENPLPEEWAEKVRRYIREHHGNPLPAVRALSSVSPALGLIAAQQLGSVEIFTQVQKSQAGTCAVIADTLDIEETAGGVVVKGSLQLVPAAASMALLLVSRGKGLVIPFSSPGVSVTPTPAIGLRAAGLADIVLNCTVARENVVPVPDGACENGYYLAIALGAGDYLSRRAKEHATGRVQFPGQMLDTEGRDGIAKLGAVKAMIARVEAWRLLLETLYNAWSHPSPLTPDASRDFGLLSSALAALAFGPENGCMAYDAGQVFGGFAYSEDDLLSRFYRDSSLFRFLAPGFGAARHLHGKFARAPLDRVFAAELGSLEGIQGAPLSALRERWNDLNRQYGVLPPSSDPHLAGEAAALIIGIRGLLARVEKGLESGKSMEAGASAAEVLFGLAEDALMKARLSASTGAVSPGAVFPVEPAGTAPVALDRDYEAFCSLPRRPHRSGAFLVSVFDRSPRYVPEIQLHDPGLRKVWIDLVGWFRQNCSEKTYEGLSFERYVEKIHGLPEEIVRAAKDKRWLATYIPRSEDGLGWRKAAYYVLNSASGSFGDAAVCLLVMASTSIGTTPVLLGLDDELPRVKEELEPLARDPGRLGEIGSRIRRITATFRNPNPSWIRKEYAAAMRLVDSRIRQTRVVKYLAANFLRAFYGAGIAGRRGDFGGFTSGLVRAAELFGHIAPDIRDGLEELPRRERCHRLFLRTLGHGGVSAFALTEPTAGSDSGGVKTTAQLRSAKLIPLPDGRYAFSLDEKDPQSMRYLIDADRVVFTSAGMAYQAPDGSVVQIRHDRYDYTTDTGMRYFPYEGKDAEFHDIGQVRKTETGLSYEYYVLTGAKMWITNGSIATQFSLYAQSPEGVTGFMVDRHAEGLKVGADEKKTGQRGSPTNEISLDSVRAPREAVIGYEGHGQVNALETLNVGRCGLAVVAGALVRKLIVEAHRSVPPSPGRDALLGEAASIIFGSESLAYYLIGLFDRAHESVRMESAIAKFVCSEDLHEIISLVERAFGPVGQTEKHLIEKARRDARILNIYEGTNEIQRFLILKDLIAQAGDWPELPEKLYERPGDESAMTLARWKNRLRVHVKAAAGRLGDIAWSDAMLQPAMFLLSETAGEILRLECVLYRREWLEERGKMLGNDYVLPLLDAGKRSVERTLARLDHLDRKFRLAWREIASDRDVAEVRAADASLDRAAETTGPIQERPGAIKTPLRLLSIIRPVADLAPHPRLESGVLREIVWRPNPLDHTGLAEALALKAASGPNVTLDALIVGGPEHDHLFRSIAGSADRLYRLDAVADHAGILDAIQALETAGLYDAVITGAWTLDGDHGLASFIAGNRGRNHATSSRIKAGAGGTGLEGITLPAVIGITASRKPGDADIGSLVEAHSRMINVIRAPAGMIAGQPRYSIPAAAPAAVKTITSAPEAANYVKSYALAASSSRSEDYGGTVDKGMLPEGPAIWAIIDPAGGKANRAALCGARMVADLFGKRSYALVTAPRIMWPLLVGLAKQNSADAAFCIETGNGVLTGEGQKEILRRIIKSSGNPIILASAEWNDAFEYIAGEYFPKVHISLVSSVTGINADAGGRLTLSSPVYDGKLIRQDQIGYGAAFIAIAGEAEIAAVSGKRGFSAYSLDVDLKPAWMRPLPPAAEPTLSQAEVVIDLGYGVRDKSGMELAHELKRKLESLGLVPMFGATRKVTQDLKLLPLEMQIGQTGVRVNPKLIIALGISGAPQHIDYVGPRAEILCFNKDAQAPLMKLNQTRPSPRVHPIAGDLFVTVREMIEKLG